MAHAEQLNEDEVLYFLSYAHTLNSCLSTRTQIHTVKLLLEWISDFPGSENPKTGGPFLVNSDFVLDLNHHRRDVPKYLKDFVASSRAVKTKAKEHFSEILAEVAPEMRPDLIVNMWKLIRQSNIADPTLRKWKSSLDEKDYAQFLADVFLYAIQVKDPHIGRKVKKAAEDAQLADDVLSDIDRLSELCEKVGFLEPIPKPPDIAQSEQAFIKPLYAAYGSIDGKSYHSKVELPKALQRDIEIRRDHFYAAETVRIQGSKTLGSIGTPQFETLKKEILAAVYDICFDHYENGFVRMKKVMTQAAVAPCVKSIFSRTRWVGSEEKQGICHILAGEDSLQWKVPDE